MLSSREEAEATIRKMESMTREEKDAKAAELLRGVWPIIKAHQDKKKAEQDIVKDTQNFRP